MLCLVRNGKYAEVANGTVELDFGCFYDFETGEASPIKRVVADGLWSNPVVLGMSGQYCVDGTPMVQNVAYDKIDYQFITYLRSIEVVDSCNDSYYSEKYVANGVVLNSFMECTLYSCLRNAKDISGDVYMQYFWGGFVKMTFDPLVNRFLAKASMLSRRKSPGARWNQFYDMMTGNYNRG